MVRWCHFKETTAIEQTTTEGAERLVLNQLMALSSSSLNLTPMISNQTTAGFLFAESRQSSSGLKVFEPPKDRGRMYAGNLHGLSREAGYGS